MSGQTTNGFYSLEGLPPQDQELFNKFGRGKAVPVPYDVIHHAFEAIVDKHESVLAIKHHDETTITYGELERRSNILANELSTSYQLQRGDRVLLVYSRCIEMVVFILAVLKSGGQYVPLDGGIIPSEALSHAINDSKTSIVLCLPKFLEKVRQIIPESNERVNVIALDAKSELWKEGNYTRPKVEVRPDNGAYVIYTSGTTGKSKGVDVLHGNVTNALLTEPANLGITVGRKVAQQLNVGFDMCAWEILATVMNGGTLHIRGSGDEPWARCLRTVDTVIATPSSVLKHMPRASDFPNIKTIVVGGEPCPKPLAESWATYANFINICGPTEITILNSAHLHKPRGELTIGKPISNTNIYILDDNENPVKIGEPGTMWTGGSGVTRGYLNLPELTEARYKIDKFTRDGRMMFNTGDLGRWLWDGNLETLGRKDDQVKVSGFRVELDGIARSIEHIPTVMKACVLKIDEGLWGFYSAPNEINEDVLRKAVAEQQPFYAVPSKWLFLPTIELTANGKVDKARLRHLATTTENEKSVVPFVPSESPSSSSLFASETLDAEKGQTHTVTVVEGEADSDSDQSSQKAKVQYTLPPKNGIHGWRWFRHTALSAYRKLFTLIFLSNLIAFIVMVWQSRDHQFSLPLPDLVTAVAANLLAAVLFRQDHVVNFIFWLATRLPTSTPLAIRRHFARIYHNGGIHSGCAVSASVWWLVFAVESTRYHFFVRPENSRFYHVDAATMVLTYMILALLVVILVMAWPSIRMKMHDQFEWTHRFAGWSTLALVWVHIVVATRSISHGDTGNTLVKTPGLYLVALITLSIASSWVRLRKVKVVAEPLSRHAVRLHFDFFTPRISSAAAVRISDRPFIEWHAFATMFEPGVKGFSIVVSRAGDWTGHIIDNPPTSIWTRGTPASGVLAIAPLFKKIVLVATGSGIGPCMPNIMENRHPIHVVWSTKNPLKVYGQKMIDIIHKCDPDAVIWNTDTQGRPDLATLAYQAYKESGAECVCIISNSSTTKKLVYRLESRGIPAFGPIWDS